MSHRRSLIIGFTPYHSHVAASIIDRLDGHIFCAFTKRWPVSATPYQKLGHMQQDLNGSWRNALMVVHFFLLLNWWRFRRVPFDVYFPHPDHLLSNPVFWLDSPGVRRYLYEDGLLNYYDAVSSRSTVGSRQRLVTLLFGHRFRACAGHLSGCDERPFDGAYLSQPEKAVRRDRLGQIWPLKWRAQPFNPRANTVLFLDHDTSAHLTVEQRAACLDTLLATYSTDRFQYFYKPHHEQASKFHSEMTSLTPELQRKPAEALVEELHPSHVVSFYSSALMNIKHSHPRIQCISIGAQHIGVHRDKKASSFSELLSEMGVESI